MVSYTVTQDTFTAVVSYAEAKKHLRLTHDYEQDQVNMFIDAAVAMAQDYTGRSLNMYNVVAKTNRFIDGQQLQRTPVSGNVEITYFDGNNTEQTLATENYQVFNVNGEQYICYNQNTTLPQVYNRADAVTISYKSGYTDSTVPVAFKQFVLLTVAYLYENRADSVDKLPRYAYSVIRPYKKWA